MKQLKCVHIIIKNTVEVFCKVDFIKFAINGAILGLCIHNVEHHLTYVETLITSLGVGLGFLLAMVLFSGMRSRIDESNIPESFKGLPVTLIAASFISLAFMGFGGIVENIFA